MGRISKHFVVTLALMGASQRGWAAQTSSTEELPEKRIEQAQRQASVGLLVEARATLATILSAPRRASDPPQWGESRTEAQKLDDQLKDREGSLRFEISGLSAGVVPAVWVDENVDPVSTDAPLRVNPGRHVVVAKTSTQQITKSVDVHERSTTAVALGFDAPASPPADEAAAASRGARSLPAAAYVGLGVGAAGFVVGSVTGLFAVISKKPTDPRCAANQCPPASWNDYDPTQKTLVRTSTASFLIGAAGVGLAVGTILMRKKHEAAASSARSIAESVRVTPGLGGMALSGKF